MSCISNYVYLGAGSISDAMTNLSDWCFWGTVLPPLSSSGKWLHELGASLSAGALTPRDLGRSGKGRILPGKTTGKYRQKVGTKTTQFFLVGSLTRVWTLLSVCNFDAWKRKPRCSSWILGALLDVWWMAGPSDPNEPCCGSQKWCS